jgi:hypothetical protein
MLLPPGRSLVRKFAIGYILLVCASTDLKSVLLGNPSTLCWNLEWKSLQDIYLDHTTVAHGYIRQRQTLG